MLFDNRTLQQKSQNTRGNGDARRTFDVSNADALRQLQGISTLQGADAAVLSAQQGAVAPNTKLQYQESGMQETTRSADTDTGISGFFGRLFSRNVSFSVNGSKIEGTNEHQVRGNTVEIMPGAVLDLAPATLTGHYKSKTEQSATGNGAYLYLAPRGTESMLQQPMNDITLASDQTIRARGTQQAVLPFGGTELLLNQAMLTQQAGGAAAIRFRSVGLKTDGDALTNVNATPLSFRNGEAVLERMAFQLDGVPMCVEDLHLDNAGLGFVGGLFVCEQDGLRDSFSLGAMPLSIPELQVKIADAKAVLAQKKAAADAAAAAAAAKAKEAVETPDPAQSGGTEVDDEAARKAKEEAARKELLCQLPTSIADGHITFSEVVKSQKEIGEYIATVSMEFDVATTGKRAEKFAGAKAEAKNVEISVNEQGEVSGDLDTLNLELGEDDYRVEMRSAAIQASKLRAENLFVEKSFENEVEVGEDDNQDLSDAQQEKADFLSFTLPVPPRRWLFDNVALQGATVGASFSKMAGTKLGFEKGDFAGSIDFDSGEFALSMKKESEDPPLQKGLFANDNYELVAAPIIPGFLDFTISAEPSSSIEGGFELKGEAGEEFFTKGKKGTLKLASAGNFKIEAGIRLNADVEAGISHILTAYAGVHAEATAEATAGIEAGVTIEKSEGGNIRAKSIDLSGDLGVELKGAIGVHGGVRFLIYKANLIEHTFKEWQLGKMQLSAAISKDTTKGLTKGWSLEKSSFNLQSFDKSFTAENTPSNRYNIKGESVTIGEAIKTNKDFATLTQELTEIVNRFNELKAAMDASAAGNGPAVAVDLTFVNEQAGVLVEFYQNLRKQGKDMIANYEKLDRELLDLKRDLAKELIDKKGGALKHQDRLAFYRSVGEKLQSKAGANMTYQQAESAVNKEREAKNPLGKAWGQKARIEAAQELNTFHTMMDYENERFQSYLKKGTEEERQKHKARIDLLTRLYDKYGSQPEELNTRVLDLYESKELIALSKKVDKRVEQKRKVDTNSSGLKKGRKDIEAKKSASESNGDAAAQTPAPVLSRRAKKRKDAMDELNVRMQYEESRAEVYSTKETEERVQEMQAARRETQALVDEYQGMEQVFATGQGLTGGRTKSGKDKGLAEMLSYIRRLGAAKKTPAQVQQMAQTERAKVDCQDYLAKANDALKQTAQATT